MSHRPRTRPAAAHSYGVLVGKIKDGTIDPASSKSPHYEIWVQADADYRIAVNARSVDDTEVIAYYDSHYTNPTKLDLPTLAAGKPGFTVLTTGDDGQGLDYLRDNLFPLDQMAPLPTEGSGMSMANLLDGQIERAKADSDSVIIAFGDFFKDNGDDHTFGFSNEQGVHDIHMMQNNPADGGFANDNRSNGDGALFIRFTGGETIALFVRFSTQPVS